ncbi:MAG: RluA family pseudouridine synthase [candidate division Zixibacteria bacterium]|nr:RluA family pseudouridine synthase [candidate division Zixibacteria bacterium]
MAANGARELRIVVGAEEAGERLDAFLGNALREYSRSRLKGFIAAGDVTVNGAAVKPSYRLREGDVVAGRLATPAAPLPAPEELPLTIYHVDEHVVVVEKPAGMLSHPAGGVTSGTLVNALLHRVGALAPVGGPSRPGIVHRLDKGTSGVMVVARSELGHRSLVKQFSRRATARTYVALAAGNLPLDEGTVEAPIGRSSRDPRRFAVSPLAAKEAKTTFTALERFGEEATLLRLRLYTGRTHQVRVHLAYLGHPVLGDAAYGSASDVIARPALHAHTLAFDHPASGRRMRFLSPLPADIIEACGRLRARAQGPGGGP